MTKKESFFIMSTIRNILRNDVEYKLLLVNETRGFARYSTLWALKRIVKIGLHSIFPHLKKTETFAYFKYHKFRPQHVFLLAYRKYIKKEIFISFLPGFGDMLEAYPYFMACKRKFPGHRLTAVIHDPEKCKFRHMRHAKARFLQLPSGEKIDYVREFIETNPFIDEIKYDDSWNDGYLYGHPVVLAQEYGFSFDKETFEKHLAFLFDSEDRVIGDRYIAENFQEGSLVISVHLKTGSELIFQILEALLKEPKYKGLNFTFVLFGAVSDGIRQLITSHQKKYCDLSNCYSKGITTRQLLYISKRCDLFIGGRGGFNGIFYLFDVPCINIFDFQGLQEMQNGLWPANLWENNEIGRYFLEEDHPLAILRNGVLPVLDRRIKGQGNA